MENIKDMQPTLTQNNSHENLVVVGTGAIKINTLITKSSKREKESEVEQNSMFKIFDKTNSIRSSLLGKMMENKVETRDS